MSLTLMDKRTGEVTFDGERARRGLPCPVCEHLHRNPSWCLIDKARGLVICPRVASKRKCGDAGWLHRIDGAAMDLPVVPFARKAAEPAHDFSDRWQRAQQRATEASRVALAERLGLPEAYVRTVPCGVDGTAWAFPHAAGWDGRGTQVAHAGWAEDLRQGEQAWAHRPARLQPRCSRSVADGGGE